MWISKGIWEAFQGRIKYLEARIEYLDKERRDMMTRIQGWEPKRDEAADVVQKQSARILAEPEDEQVESEESELIGLGLKQNEGGGYVQVATGALFESVAAFQSYQEWLRQHGLPPNTHPNEIETVGEAGR